MTARGLLVTTFAAMTAVWLLASGCAQTATRVADTTPLPDRAERLPRGYIYYLDGAGGGMANKNWAEGVKEGLLAAGYSGAGEMFSWETGKGMIADQDASVPYKRAKAAELARHIMAYKKDYPGAPVSILGFSAGAAVAAFTLEALPLDCQVDTVVLLGASISADYDLTQALLRVRGHLYYYTSPKDMMLGFLMPFTGTADRKYDEAAAGAKGFTLPPGAGEETRKLYAEKVAAIAWTKQLERDGDYGRHFDNVKMEFIRDRVAPLIMRSRPSDAPAPTAGLRPQP